MALMAFLATNLGTGGARQTRTVATAFAGVSLTAASWNLASMSRRSVAFLDRYGPRSNHVMNHEARGGSSSIQRHSTVASISDLEQRLEVTHPAYDVVSKEVVNEYGAYCTLYKHKKSGAELLSVASDDDNKVFGITFRTPPNDSTGVPHILEHSVLCGSRKYKTKDPFVQLLQGSLQTFLNAFTYPDRTCYVVASQNTKDFYNLINVYADAVYHPRAITDPNVHAQEGWHLELEKLEDDLTYKGVVYNEMKGVYSSPDSLLSRESQRAIFPNNAYSVDSGGDPVAIPDLSFEQFADFHKKYYHPANSRIYFSGDDDIYTRLQTMDDYLSEFDPSPESKPASTIQWQPKNIAEPRWEQHPYPSSPSSEADEGAKEDKTHMVMVNWLLNDQPLTPTECLVIEILDSLLMGTPQSTLYKALMESGLGSAITGGGLSDELLQSTFSVGLKGVQQSNVKQVETLILDTISNTIQQGFDQGDIDSAMNTMEFKLREFNTGSFPRGLSLMLGAMSKWIYDGSPTEALKFEEPLQELKSMILKDGDQVFKDFAQKFLQLNQHRVTIEMVPDETLEANQLKAEKERLTEIKQSMQEEQLQEIINKTSELKRLQAAEDDPEARATIPSLELSDLKRDVTEFPIEVCENHDNSGVTLVKHEFASTSGIVYANFGIDIRNVPIEDVPLLSLFSRMLTETGAGSYSDIELSRRIGTHTGGIAASVSIRSVRPDGVAEGVVHNGSHLYSKLFIKGKATADKATEMFDIMKLILTDANLNSQARVIEMLKETKARLESAIQGSGHSIANTRMRSHYTVTGYLGEITGGITYLDTVTQLLKDAEDNWDSVHSRLLNIKNIILNEETCRNGMILDITADASVMNNIAQKVDNFLSTIPGKSDGSKLPDLYSSPHPWAVHANTVMSDPRDEGFVVPTQVSYVGKGGRLFKEGEYVAGSTAVVSRFLRTGYLWDRVRVMGGAYGGFCQFDPKSNDGVFTFLSYRDPNLGETLDVYDATATALKESAKALEEDKDALATAIIGAVGDLDGALSVDQKGAVAFNRWIARESPEYRQKFRDEVLTTSADDFCQMAEALGDMSEESVAVVSSKSKFDETAEKGKTLELKQVM
eukprot:CAMPEP_0184855064 /NCGR_PEP_ID=MMETSP0580-20130426/395_1 /TAXON_ID=1118495 /ORGANISM="Dactyliosolen fragilissimus" /LENGTH=1109 /DNA_ID=CAMNT_0027349485 /DNA_START=174 /DNA_END=3503 /DNA_ORIENTATION=-